MTQTNNQTKRTPFPFPKGKYTSSNPESFTKTSYLPTVPRISKFFSKNELASLDIGEGSVGNTFGARKFEKISFYHYQKKNVKSGQT